MRQSIYNRFRTLGMKLPVGCTRLYEHLFEIRLNRRYHRGASRRAKSVKPTAICMLNGRTHHAGLADRLYGIISCYNAAKQLGIDYRISFTNPFRLSDYLIPNQHNWIIDDDVIDDKQASAIFIRALNPPHNDKRHRQLIKALKSAKKQQIHIYSNLKTVNGKQLAQMFNELFRPADRLEAEMSQHLNKLGANYASVSFRFQQLLGDFTDTGARQPLPADQRQQLIDTCLKALDDLYATISDRYDKLLIASDSSTFVEAAATRPYAYVIPGEIAHIQFSADGKSDAHLKTFLDLMMIARAKESFLIKAPGMYDSGFPRLASDLGGHPFNLIEISK